MDRPDNIDISQAARLLDEQRQDLLGLLDRLVSVNSFSANREGVSRAVELALQALPPSLTPVNGYSPENSRLWLRQNCAPDARPIMLVGHLDTVFPPGDFDSGIETRGAHLHGPGAADMKGGVVVILGALRILEQLGLLSEIPILTAFNGDEEIGSPDSGPILYELAGDCRLGLVFECGGQGQEVVTSRRGVRRYRMIIRGQSGHSGFTQGEKKSALVELSHQILRLEAFNKPRSGVSVNVGRAWGGTAANVVPGLAEAELELRFWDEKAGNLAAERIMASMASPVVLDLQLSLERTHSRPAMPRTPEVARLFKDAEKIARLDGVKLKEEARPGASDANILTAAGLPALDGLGPVGEMDHSNRERILAESLFERILLVVRLLWGLRGWSA